MTDTFQMRMKTKCIDYKFPSDIYLEILIRFNTFILFIIMIRGILDLGQIARYKIRVVYVCVDLVDFPFHWL